MLLDEAVVVPQLTGEVRLACLLPDGVEDLQRLLKVIASAFPIRRITATACQTNREPDRDDV